MSKDRDLHQQRFITPASDEWPHQLEGLGDDAPAGLWVMGLSRLNDLTSDAVALVGARASTPYGDHVAHDMAGELARADYTIVGSGGFGIDAAALRAAVAEGRPTVVVQAGGLDRLYPAANAALFERVLSQGGLIVSEYEPGTVPTRAQFIARTRVIAGLVDGTVIVEGAERSTARQIISWGNVLRRPTMAVPGPVTSVTSVQPHRLIKQGQAAMVTDATDVVTHLKAYRAPSAAAAPPTAFETVTPSLAAPRAVGLATAAPDRAAMTW